MSKKITELTQEEKDMMPFYRDKWIKIGLSTKETNKEEILKWMPEYYKEGGLNPPKKVIFIKDPLSAALTISILRSEVIDGETFVKKDLENYVTNSLSSPMRQTVIDEIFTAVTSVIAFGKEQGLEMKATAKTLTNNFYKDYVGGNLWAGWQSFYDYMMYLGIEKTKKLIPTFKLSENACYMFPYENICFVTEKPKKISTVDNKMHDENTMAIQWRNNVGFYFLNGVKMEPWLFETPKDQINPKDILAISNVEQRSEAIAWYGMEKLYKLLDRKVIDSDDDGYELMLLDVGTGRKEEYLKMINNSTSEIHVEGVGENIKTVEGALEFRWPEHLRNKYGYKKPIAIA